MVNSKVNVEKVILICSSCGKETSEGNTSKNILNRVKRSLKENNLQVLALLTTCLGVCPEQGTTIGYSSKDLSGLSLEVISDDFSEELILQRI